MKGANGLLRSRWREPALWVGALALLVVVWAVPPRPGSIYPPCLMHLTTGFYCPGCGSGRGLHHLLHGRLAAAWACNPLLVLILPPVLYSLAGRVFTRVTGRRWPGLPQTAWLAWGLLGVVLVYTVLRNVPAYPFTLLAPHGG